MTLQTSSIAADMPSLKEELTIAIESCIAAWVSAWDKQSISNTPGNLQTSTFMNE